MADDGVLNTAQVCPCCGRQGWIALYLRISKDKSKRAEGVENQEKWGREYAGSKWPDMPIMIYCDNDITAAKDDVVRPDYERLKADVGDGRVAHIWCVEQYRIERGEVRWFMLAALLDSAGIEELHTDRDGVVRVLDEVAGIKAVLGAGEVRRNRKRLMDTLAEVAAKGRPAGATPFPYEHAVNEDGEKTYRAIPERAEACRSGAQQVLTGWALGNIAADWRARGLVGRHRVKLAVNGKRWYKDGRNGPKMLDEKGRPVTRTAEITDRTVKKALTAPAIAGFRVLDKEIIGKGNWEPVLDEATWRAVCARLSTPHVVQRKDGGTYRVPAVKPKRAGRKYLLTGGTAVCGVCNAPLMGTDKQMKQSRRAKLAGEPKIVKPYYVCHSSRGGRNCVGVMGEAFEEYVGARLVERLESREFLEAVGSDDSAGHRERILTELAEVDVQRRELAELWGRRGSDGRRRLSTQEWAIARDGLDEDEQRLRAELSALPAPMEWSDPALIVAAWKDPETTLDERRRLVELYIMRVTLYRARPGRKSFDPDRVQILWRPVSRAD